MNKRQIRITLITLGVAVIAGAATWLRADDATPAAAPADQSTASKFHGKVTAVDTNAMTFTVNDQALTITDESRMRRNGKSATLADVVVGDPASGSYTKGADGKLDVTKVRFGKKAGAKKKNSEDTDTAATNAPPAAPQSN